MIIRPAGFPDTEAIFFLIKEYPEELLPRAISDIDQNIDRFLVGERDGLIVGVVSWQILPEIGVPTHPAVEIKSLAVRPSERRRGIGRAMVKAAVERIRGLLPSQIIVLTFSPAFFGKFGFHEVPKQTLMHKIYMGCITCTKYDSPFTCPEVAMSLNLVEG